MGTWVRFNLSSIYLVLCLVTQSCLTLRDPMDCSPSGSSVHGDSPGKNTRVGCHALLQAIFPIQGLNPGLPHCRWILHHVSHQGSPLSTLVHSNSCTFEDWGNTEFAVVTNIDWLMQKSHFLNKWETSLNSYTFFYSIVLNYITLKAWGFLIPE